MGKWDVIYNVSIEHFFLFITFVRAINKISQNCLYQINIIFNFYEIYIIDSSHFYGYNYWSIPKRELCTKYKSSSLLMCMSFQMTDNRIMQTNDDILSYTINIHIVMSLQEPTCIWVSWFNVHVQLFYWQHIFKNSKLFLRL